MYIWGVHSAFLVSSSVQRVLSTTQHLQSHSTLLLIPSKSPCLELRHHLRLDALPEARRRGVLIATTANQTLTNELQQHLRLDALPEARSRHVPVKTANQTLTNKFRLVRLDALPEARSRQVLLVVLLVSTVYRTLLTDPGRSRRIQCR